MTDKEGTWQQPPVQGAARRWTGILVASVIFLMLVMSLGSHEPLRPFTPERMGDFEVALKPLTVRSLIGTASLLGMEMEEKDGLLVIVARARVTGYLRVNAGINHSVISLAILLLAGACMAGSAWGMGPIRRVAFALTGIALSVTLLPILNGVLSALILMLPEPIAGGGFDASVYMTALITVLLWWLLRKIAVDDPVSAVPSDGRRMIMQCSPLAWVAMFMIVGAIVRIAFWETDASSKSWRGLVESTSRDVTIALPALLASGVMLALGILSKSRVAKWAWIPLVLLLMCPGSAIVWAAVFLCVAVAGNEPWQAARTGRPISETDWDRIRIRSHLPLLPVAVALFVIAILGAVPLLGVWLDWPIGTMFTIPRRPYFFWPAALGAIALGGWDLWALKCAKSRGSRQVVTLANTRPPPNPVFPSPGT